MIESERLVADALDALRVRWEYEPRLFALATDGNGNCKHGFQPDFYLPEHDLYIEVTRAKEQYPKNRKLRLLQEQYPDVRCFLFGRKDFERPRERLLEILTWPAYEC